MIWTYKPTVTPAVFKLKVAARFGVDFRNANGALDILNCGSTFLVCTNDTLVGLFHFGLDAVDTQLGITTFRDAYRRSYLERRVTKGAL